MKNYVQKAYAYNQTVRIYAAITTQLCEEARVIHNLWPTSCGILGRVLTIAAIMSTTYKEKERLTFRINGGGPVGQITCEASDGFVRGFVQNPGIYLTNNDTGKINISSGVGDNGFIHVTKDLHMRHTFTSTSEIQTGDIANDFTYYFAKSEQIPSSVGLGLAINKDQSVKAAGGFLIQVMPGCKSEYLDDLEKRLKSIKPASQMIEEGYNTEQMINEITGGAYEILETKELGYRCDCSKERFYNGIKSLGAKEVESIIVEDKGAEVRCHFCGEIYNFSEDELKQILTEIDNNSTLN